MQVNRQQKIPVTLLTGFLGSGKTTTLNHWLSLHPTESIAVIENEFAAEGIDELLIDNSADRVIPISKGCICCSQNGALLEAIEALISDEHQPQQILIEATGIANPAEIVTTLLTPHLQDHIDINAVICIVDAHRLLHHLDQFPEVAKQIALADYLLINKMDQIIPSAKQQIEATVNAINPMAIKEYTTHGKFAQPLDQLNSFHQNSLSFDTTTKATGNEHTKFQSFSFQFEERFDFNALNFFLGQYLQFNRNKCYRIKGIIQALGFEQPMILQSVGENIIWRKAAKDTAKKSSTIIVIGVSLNKQQLEKILNSCLAQYPEIDRMH